MYRDLLTNNVGGGGARPKPKEKFFGRLFGGASPEPPTNRKWPRPSTSQPAPSEQRVRFPPSRKSDYNQYSDSSPERPGRKMEYPREQPPMQPRVKLSFLKPEGDESRSETGDGDRRNIPRSRYLDAEDPPKPPPTKLPEIEDRNRLTPPRQIEPERAEPEVRELQPRGDAVWEEERPATGTQPKQQTKKIVYVKRPATVEIGTPEVSPSPPKTLHLAAHLVDEDKLKDMSSGLKRLYEAQLQLQEEGFKGQLKQYKELLSTQQKYHNKELDRFAERDEVRKKEMATIHEEYQEQLKRLRNELTEMEDRNRRANTELARLAQEKLQSPDTGRLIGQAATMFAKSVEGIITQKMAEVTRTIATTFSEKMAGLNEIHSEVKSSNCELDGKLTAVSQSLEGLKKNQQREVKISAQRFSGIETRIQTEFQGIQKRIDGELVNLAQEQKKVRDIFLKGSVDKLNETLIASKEVDKKESRLARNIRGLNESIGGHMTDLGNQLERVKHVCSLIHRIPEDKDMAAEENQFRSAELVRRAQELDQLQERINEKVQQRRSEFQRERDILSSEKEELDSYRAEVCRMKAQAEIKKNELDRRSKEMESKILEVKNYEAEATRKLANAKKMRNCFTGFPNALI